jgi:NAD(P)-dependent dehydrogenase (short-subunit alcohol dehydrogenase family)
MRTAIVTGGSSGLGLALSRSLITAGWTVVADGRNVSPLAAAEAELGSRFLGIPGDVTDAAHRRALVAAAGQRIDLVVNNASTLGPLPMPRLEALAGADFARVLETNVIAPLALVQDALPFLVEGGAVLNVTSDAAVEGYPGWGAYGASKAALEQLSRVLASELPDLRVWWVDPGDMRTQMHQDAFPGEDITDRPLPEDVVPAFLRLIEERPPSGRIKTVDRLALPA